MADDDFSDSNSSAAAASKAEMEQPAAHGGLRTDAFGEEMFCLALLSSDRLC